MQALYQLSYTPDEAPAVFLAEWTGLEPATPGVTGRYSNRLNYHSALMNLASPRGFEPRLPP